MAFFGRIDRVIYRQFSVTIVSAMVLSSFVALVLTPALCATLLKPVSIGHAERTVGSSRSSTLRFENGRARYVRALEVLLGKRAPSIVVYGVIVAVMAVLIVRMPTGFFPAEDQGGLSHRSRCRWARCSRARSRSQSRSSISTSKTKKANVHTIFIVAGFSFAGQGQNTGQAFVNLTDWDERPGEVNSAQAIVGRAFKTFFEDPRMRRSFRCSRRRCVNLAIDGLRNGTRDRGDLGHDALMAARDQLLTAARKNPLLAQVRQERTRRHTAVAPSTSIKPKPTRWVSQSPISTRRFLPRGAVRTSTTSSIAVA